MPTIGVTVPTIGVTMRELIQERLTQLQEEVKQRSTHKNPMYYAALNNLRWCRIVSTLMDGGEPDIGDVEAVCGVKQARSNPEGDDSWKKMIKEGANVMDILNKYREAVPDIHDRLEQEVANLGYKVQGFYIIKK